MQHFLINKMPNLKRAVSFSGNGSSKKRRTSYVPRTISMAKSSNSVMVKRTVRYGFDLSTDFAGGFAFTPTTLWYNGATSVAIDGASDITNLFDQCRIKKVEVIILPSCDGLDYYNVSTTARNVPYVYIAADKNDSSNPTLAAMLQYDNLHITELNHVIRYTCYPKMLTGSSSIVVPNNNWAVAGTDIPYFGIKIYVDNTTTNQPNAGGSINFIIHYECKDSK